MLESTSQNIREAAATVKSLVGPLMATPRWRLLSVDAATGMLIACAAQSRQGQAVEATTRDLGEGDADTSRQRESWRQVRAWAPRIHFDFS
jgi:hypothetical protein